MNFVCSSAYLLSLFLCPLFARAEALNAAADKRDVKTLTATCTAETSYHLTRNPKQKSSVTMKYTQDYLNFRDRSENFLLASYHNAPLKFAAVRGFVEPTGENAQARVRSLTTTFSVVNKKVITSESLTDVRRFYLDDKNTRDEVFNSSYPTDRKSTGVNLPGDRLETTDDERNLSVTSGSYTITARRQKCIYQPNDGAVEKWKPALRATARKFEAHFRETLRAEELAEACAGPVSECEARDAEAERLVLERESLWKIVINEVGLSLSLP